jgi:5-methylcytosine-specific restriction protein A
VRSQSAAEHEERRGTSAERGYDYRWQRLREAHLASEPLCRMCLQAGRITPAVLVDHIVPINDGGAVLDDDNLQSLCRSCHDKKTADDIRKRRSAG